MGKHKVIGLMSGTSLDGLDIAYCEFEKKKTWRYKIVYAETVKFTKDRKAGLKGAIHLKKTKLVELDKEFGRFLAAQTIRFIRKKKITPELIASHGHTVFHRPEKGITLQIGNGQLISDLTKLPVVCDFRSGDVQLGGQGAPLVPLVDKLLFSEYTFCLNLGGFANISYDKKSRRIAFDICPVNIVLNDLANLLGKEFDRGGKMASKGVIHSGLLRKLNALPFYRTHAPKSLGREWVEKQFLPILDPYKISVRDKLRTVTEHVAIQISLAINSELPARTLFATGGIAQLLVTGGGAYNDLLIKRISFHANCKVVLPDDKTIQFKEAMAFALLGLLRIKGEINILKSVTGAKKDSSGGRICFSDQKASSS